MHFSSVQFFISPPPYCECLIGKLQNDMSGLVSQLKQIQKNNAELDEANRALALKVFFFSLIE